MAAGTIVKIIIYIVLIAVIAIAIGYALKRMGIL